MNQNRFICWNTWSPVRGIVWERLAGVGLVGGGGLLRGGCALSFHSQIVLSLLPVCGLGHELLATTLAPHCACLPACHHHLHHDDLTLTIWNCKSPVKCFFLWITSVTVFCHSTRELKQLSFHICIRKIFNLQHFPCKTHIIVNPSLLRGSQESLSRKEHSI